MIHGVKPDCYSEILQLLEDTAQDIATATTNTSQWPDFILYLLKSLEKHKTSHDNFDERLVTICVK